MSGHSKWSKIKRQKGVSDQKKGQLFSKLGKKISVAAKDGADPTANYKLQAVIDEARAANMPKENIERAIKRASDKDSLTLQEFVIQAMGPSGIAVAVEGITDNTNRSISEIRTILSRNDVKVVPEGSLNWMFQNKEPLNPLEITDEQTLAKIDKIMEELDDYDDVENIYTNLKE